MKKKCLPIILTIVIPITVTLTILGFIFDKTELEKINGFTGLFAISKDGNIAYVNYNEGESEMYLHRGNGHPIMTLSAEKEITDMIFSPDGLSLIYVVNEKEITDPERLESTVYEINLNTFKQTTLFHENKIVTEITFDPKSDETLFYLAAETFENYSPIARQAPHNFDIYSYSLKNEEIKRYTQFKKYGITSLQISQTDPVAYVQMADDFHVDTADAVFEMKQRVFEIPLEHPEDLRVISDIKLTQDIYDMYYIYEYDTIIYQAVSQTSDEGIFEYELFARDLNEQTNTQLTYLSEYTAQPIYSKHDDKIYFIVDKQFAKQFPDNYLYRMNRDGSHVEELNLN